MFRIAIARETSHGYEFRGTRSPMVGIKERSPSLGAERSRYAAADARQWVLEERPCLLRLLTKANLAALIARTQGNQRDTNRGLVPCSRPPVLAGQLHDEGLAHAIVDGPRTRATGGRCAPSTLVLTTRPPPRHPRLCALEALAQRVRVGVVSTIAGIPRSQNSRNPHHIPLA